MAHRVALFACVATAIAFTAGPALPCTPEAFVTFDKREYGPGETAIATGNSFDPDSPVPVQIYMGSTLLASVPVNAYGGWQISFTIPADAKAGTTYRLRVVAQDRRGVVYDGQAPAWFAIQAAPVAEPQPQPAPPVQTPTSPPVQPPQTPVAETPGASPPTATPTQPPAAPEEAAPTKDVRPAIGVVETVTNEVAVPSAASPSRSNLRVFAPARALQPVELPLRAKPRPAPALPVAGSAAPAQDLPWLALALGGAGLLLLGIAAGMLLAGRRRPPEDPDPLPVSELVLESELQEMIAEERARRQREPVH